MDNYEMSSNLFEIAEHKTYLELKRRSCWYGHPNLNNVELPIENAEENAQTLVGQPVVAKYRKINQKDDLGGHECSVNSNGEMVFNTVPIGVNTAVEIRDDNIEINGEIVNAPCLFVTSRVWKRNKNVCEAIKRLFSEKLLRSSWEILISKYEVDNNKKILKEYEFEADCLLGSKSNPAYGKCATTLEMAEEMNIKPEIIIAEAIEKDFEINTKEDSMEEKETNVTEISDSNSDNTTSDDIVKNNDNVTTSDNNVGTENVDITVDNESTEVSSLTVRDIRVKIEEAYRVKYNKYGWIAYMFPAENYVLIEPEGRLDELAYIKVSYEVNGDSVAIGDAEDVKLVVSVSEINKEVSEKNDVIIKANNTITELNSRISELEKYKEAYDSAMAEKEKAILAEKQESLKKYAIKSGFISAEEIETSDEIKAMIANVDENAVKALIVDRLMSQKTDEVTSDVESADGANEVITSSVVNDINDGDYKTDYKSIMKDFLKR